MRAPRVPLGDLVQDVDTWTPRKHMAGEPFAYIDLSAIDQFAKVVSTPAEVARQEAPSRARQLVNSGDVLVSTVRPNLNAVAQVPEELHGATASTGFCVLRPDPNKLDPRYLFHWVKTPTFIGDMTRRATGASYPAVSDRIIRRSTLPLPALEEQRRIAEVLDRAEALRTKRRAAIEQLETLKQSIFLDMFGDPVANPHDWPESSLAEVSLIAGEYGAGVPSREFDASLPRYIRITDVTDGGGLTSEAVSPGRGRKEWERYRLAPGDVLFARSGATVGKTYLHRGGIDAVFAGYFIRFRTNATKLLPEVLFEFTKTTAYGRWVENRKRTVAQPNINAKQYGQNLRLPIPPIPLQEEFAGRLQMIDSAKENCQAAGTFLNDLFACIQQREFQGDL